MGTSAKDVKNRIKSVESTMHITKAMELVASSKLRKAKERMEKSRSYFDIMSEALSDIASEDRDGSSVFLKQRESKKSCYIVIAGDRGLAGGYNNNIFKLYSENAADNSCVVPIGKRSFEHFKKRGVEILSEDYSVIDTFDMEKCISLASLLVSGFKKGDFDSIYIVYTNFDSMLSQTPRIKKILPPEIKKAEKSHGYILYEPSPEAVLDAVIPEYISGMIYSAVSESYASELAARRTAMDSASKNAEEMIDDLSLKYNRARQNAITQEITEIVAGAEG